MSAFDLKADMPSGIRNVRFWPKADIGEARLNLNEFVGYLGNVV